MVLGVRRAGRCDAARRGRVVDGARRTPTVRVLTLSRARLVSAAAPTTLATRCIRARRVRPVRALSGRVRLAAFNRWGRRTRASNPAGRREVGALGGNCGVLGVLDRCRDRARRRVSSEKLPGAFNRWGRRSGAFHPTGRRDRWLASTT